MALLAIYVALALGVSFLCSVMEAVLLSASPSYVANEVRTGSRTGKLFAGFKDDVDRPLAAILTLNTIAHTVGAAGAGAQATAVFGEAWFGVISAILTLLILFLSEIIPKTLGAVYWRQLAPVAAVMLRFTIVLMYPMVVVARGLTRAMTPNRREPSISRRELAAMAELSATQGVLAGEESRLFKNLLRFRSVRVEEVMTPRLVLVTLDASLSVREVLEDKPLRYSRIPVYANGNKDDIVGYVLKDQVLMHAARDELDRQIAEFQRKLLVVPPTLTLPTLFRHLLEHGEHIALVADEYGDVAGLVTMEDVIETLLGLQIVDEADLVTDMRELAHRFRRVRDKRRAQDPSQGPRE